MLRFAFSMLVATVAIALLAGSVINGKLKISLPQLPQPAAVVAVQQPPAPQPAPLPTPAPTPSPAAFDTASNASDDSYNRIEIAPNRVGNFETDIEVHGRTIHVMIDTGATYFVLTAEDADRLGLYLEPADFRYRLSTANGFAMNAKVHLSKVWIGNFEIDEVDALVAQPRAMQISLLGMNVLRRLGGIHISDGRLVLER
jgi:aspartyl protease family protein